ncbi:MAG: undecaprenyl-diphosphate phosphatase, partial [Acidobacteriota bacterium]
MTVFQAFVLGLVQGITEFLPISSSAHLILVPHVFGWNDQGLSFDIVANTGSLVAVLVYFRHDLWSTMRHPLTFRADSEGRDDLPSGGAPLLPAIAIGTVPVVVAGLLIYDWLSTGARTPTLIAAT